MDINNFLDGIEEAAVKLTAYWPEKIVLAGMIAAVQFHLQLMALFIALILIDLATKWIELAYNAIKTDDYSPDIVESIRAIPKAHRMGIISSKKMKTQFCHKIIVYTLVVMAGSIMDAMTIRVNGGGLVMPLCIYYLAASELLSIIENLDAAGVSALHGLVVLIKKKRGA